MGVPSGTQAQSRNAFLPRKGRKGPKVSNLSNVLDDRASQEAPVIQLFGEQERKAESFKQKARKVIYAGAICTEQQWREPYESKAFSVPLCPH